MANTILVTGATGKQGGAVIESLLSSSNATDLIILALTRNPDSPASKALLLKSPSQIKLVKGDLKDCDAVFKAAAEPVEAVFSVSIPVVGFKANDDEEVNGKALIDAALANDVKHFVYTSVDRHGVNSDTEETDVPHFISKARVEKHLIECCKGSKMAWTILRPTAFMDNIEPSFAGKIFPTAWKVGLSPTTKLQLIATEDIGHFGAQALLHPKEFAGRAISLAGDELTFDEANRIFAKEVGYDMPTTFGFIPSAAMWAIKDVGLMFKFFEDVGYAADVGALRAEHPKLLSFSDWLKQSQFVAK